MTIDPSKSERLASQERAAASLEDVIRAFVRQDRLDLHTALPGIVQGYDPGARTVSVQCAIQRQIAGVGPVSVPLLVDVPLVFPEGGGFTLTFPVMTGDECLVIFSERCIDAWWALGGVQPLAELRAHDYSDGFAILGVRSRARPMQALPPIDGVGLIAGGVVVLKVTPTGVQVTGSLTATGSISATGNVTGATVTGLVDVLGGGKSVLTHTHLAGVLLAGSTPVTGTTGVPL